MTDTRAQQQSSREEKLPAQYVNYLFFKLDPVWRRLDEEERERGKKEFLEAVEEHSQDMLLRSFSLMGLRSDADFMLWRIGYDLDAFEKMTSALMKTGLGKYLEVTYSYFALARRSIYVGEHMKIGRKHYPVKNNTAYCFGIDDYEFILSFEAESPEKFQNLMMELRESEASAYTELDTPIFTCRRKGMTEILESLA